MAEYIVEITQDNSVDLPVEVRNKLALEPGDKMVLSVDSTGEHLVMGKLPMDVMEKARDIDKVLGKPIKIQ